MSYQVLARKWRPRNFTELVGQEHVQRALVNALDNDRLHHAYLFTGTRGVGKTTIARIFAKSLNCEKGVSSHPCGECSACTENSEGLFIDLVEVDAVEAGGGVRIGVGRPTDLIEELGGDRARRNQAPGPRVFGDHEAPVGFDFGDGKSGMLETGLFSATADFDRMGEAMNRLSETILTLQGNGDYDGVARLIDEYGQVGPELQGDLDRLAAAGIPVDVVFEQGIGALRP